MGSFSVYIVSMISFIVFRYKYILLERHFVNKLGITSAVIGIIIFLFTFIAVGFFQNDFHHSITMYVCFVAIVSIYYFAYARYVQCFSPEEQSILFAVYVIKSNSRKKTIWSWVGRKVHRTVDRIDPNHHLADLLSWTDHGHKKASNSSSRISGAHSPKKSASGIGTGSVVVDSNVQVFTIDDEDKMKNDELDDHVESKRRNKSVGHLATTGENTAIFSLSNAKIVSVEEAIDVDDEEEEYN